MKVVKINAIWCSACLVMNKTWNNVSTNKNIETLSLDYDIDNEKVKKYEPGSILPVFIFYINDKEVRRIVGEHSEKELNKIIMELENEESNI